MNFYNATLRELSELLSKKEISSYELTQGFLSRIDEKNEKIGAYITVCEEEALAWASRADAMIAKGENGMLTGIPVGVKDNICTAKIRTTCASKMLESYVPTYDAFVVEKLKRTGMPILGKTNLDEFAMGAFGTDSALLESKNPIGRQFVPGGSSSGSAVAVAAGLAPAALGSDTGGSVRVPASFCGLCGFKPSYGAISRFGLVAYASSLDTIGTIARSVDDLELFTTLLFGKDERDMTSQAFSSCGEEISLQNVRFAFSEDDLIGATPEICDLLIRLSDVLVRAGMIKVKKSAFYDTDMDRHYTSLACAEAVSNLARYDGIKYGFGDCGDVFENREKAFGKEVKKRIDYGNFVLRRENFEELYETARVFREDAKKKVSELFDMCDIVVSPLCDFNVPRFGETDNLRADKFTVLANFTGVPALSMPIGRDKNGMPVSVQIMSKRFSDYRLLSIAKLVEKLLREEDAI